MNVKSEPAAYADGKPVHVPSAADDPAASSTAATGATPTTTSTAPATSTSGTLLPSPPNSGSPTGDQASAAVRLALGTSTSQSSDLTAVSNYLNNTSAIPERSATCRYGYRCRLCTWSRPHFHCTHPRCHFATEVDEILLCHLTQFHANIDVREGYEFYDSQVECNTPGCNSKGLTRHYHCTRPGCGYSFVRYWRSAFLYTSSKL